MKEPIFASNLNFKTLMKKLKLLLLGLLFFPLKSQDLQNKLDSIVQLQGLKAQDPALFIGIVKEGEILYQKVQGLANLQHQVAATASSRSNIASTAKQFTALMILDLSQQGKLSLEDDIRQYLPHLYPTIKDSIRIRHLLNHTSGIRDYCDMMSLQGKAWWRREGLDNKDVIELMQRQQSLAFKPGSRYKYSNTGYNLLAEIVALVSGEKFHLYAKAFFEKLGMPQSGFPKSYMQVIPELCLPYSDWGDGVWQEYPRLTSTAGEGFLYTSLKDQLHYEQLLQKAEESNNTLLLASQKSIPKAERKDYGFGLRLTDRKNHPAVHHDGSTGSYSSQVLRFPEEQISIFIMTSNSRVSTDALLQGISDLLLEDRPLKIAYSPLMTSLSAPAKNFNPVGQYRSPSGALIRINTEEKDLNWNSGTGSGIALQAETKNLYHPYYDENLKIGFWEDRLILFDPNGDTTVYPKIHIASPSYADFRSYLGTFSSEELDVNFTLSLEGESLMLQRGDWSTKKELTVFNRDEFRYRNYIFRVQRDPFDRVQELSLNYARALNIRFGKSHSLKTQATIASPQGSISISTIPAADGSASDIALTENNPEGNEIWYRQFGGSSYDKGSAVIATDDGYLLIGSTSSYGVGNYDILVIKTNKQGKKQWQKTYGRLMNDYGYAAALSEEGFLIKGSTQTCVDNDVFNCRTNVWFIYIDKKGNELSNEILEEI